MANEKKAEIPAQKQETAAPAAKGLQAKLLALQASVRGLGRDAEGSVTATRKYQYLSGDKLFGVVRPAMDTLGLRLTQEIIYSEMQIIGGTQAIVPFRFTWIDTESGEREEVTWIAAGSNTPLDKAIGSATTYAERYFVMKQLHLSTDGDDTDALSPEEFKTPESTERRPATRKPAASQFCPPEGTTIEQRAYAAAVAFAAGSDADYEKSAAKLRNTYGFNDWQMSFFEADVKKYANN